MHTTFTNWEQKVLSNVKKKGKKKKEEACDLTFFPDGNKKQGGTATQNKIKITHLC